MSMQTYPTRPLPVSFTPNRIQSPRVADFDRRYTIESQLGTPQESIERSHEILYRQRVAGRILGSIAAAGGAVTFEVVSQIPTSDVTEGIILGASTLLISVVRSKVNQLRRWNANRIIEN